MQFGWNILPKPVQELYSRSSYPWNWYFFPPDIHCLSNGIGENTDAGGNKSIWPTWYFTEDHPQVCGQTDISGTVSHITRAAGFGGLFRGLGITATREVPAFAVYFSSYEVIVRWGPDMIRIRIDLVSWSGTWGRAQGPFSSVVEWLECYLGWRPIRKTSSSLVFKQMPLVPLRCTGVLCIVLR